MNHLKIYFFICCIAAVSFTACKQKDEKNENTTAAENNSTLVNDSSDGEFELATDVEIIEEPDSNVIFASNKAAAQMKIGYVNSTEILLKLGDVKKADAELEKMARTLDAQIQRENQNFQQKYTKYMQETDVTETILKMRQEELQGMQQRLMQLQYSSEEELARKKEQLYKPIYDKVNRVIKNVATAHGYTHILDGTALLYIDDAYDVTPIVKRQLGINN